MTTKDTPRIQNVKQVTNTAARYKWMSPDGDIERVKVDNPRLDRHQPEYLRLSVPRKMTETATLFREMEEMGLKVADVWQYDADRRQDRLRVKLEATEA